MPSDEQITAQIEKLETERTPARSRESGSDPTREADAALLDEVRLDRDRLWDLLRQRRALRQDPDGAHERSAGIVERY